MAFVRLTCLILWLLIVAFPSSGRILILELALRGRFHEVPKVMFLRRVHALQLIRAYTSKREMAAWFSDSMEKPGYGQLFPEWLLVAEYAKAILRDLVSPGIPIRCLFLLYN